MSTTEDAAATATGDEAQGDPASGSEEQVEFPTFETEIPADLAAFLEEDDTDTSVSEEELDDLVAENEDVPRDVLARMRAAEKRAEHLERLRVGEAKKNWADEAKTHFPLSEPFLDEITATSRRGFLRTAKTVHEKMLPIVEEKVLKPAREAIESKKTEAVTEGKEEAKKAWGQAADDGGVPSEARVTLAQSQERRRPRELSDTIRAMIFPKES